MVRELHDVVADRLTAIALHSTAALSLGDPASAQNALSVIRENGVEGLSEMRRLVAGLLRDRGGEGKWRRCRPWTAWAPLSRAPAPTAWTSPWTTLVRPVRNCPRRSTSPRTGSPRSP